MLVAELADTPVPLRCINELIDDRDGRESICKRLPEEAVRTVLQGPRINAIDVLGSRIAEVSVPKAERGRREARLLVHRNNEQTRSWAIAAGCFCAFYSGSWDSEGNLLGNLPRDAQHDIMELAGILIGKSHLSYDVLDVHVFSEERPDRSAPMRLRSQSGDVLWA